MRSQIKNFWIYSVTPPPPLILLVGIYLRPQAHMLTYFTWKPSIKQHIICKGGIVKGVEGKSEFSDAYNAAIISLLPLENLIYYVSSSRA